MLMKRSSLLPICAAIPMLLMAAQPLNAEVSSDSERLEKLEKAVEQLQKRNVELEQEVRNLKSEHARVSQSNSETNPKIASDGKASVEKNVVTEEKKTVFVTPAGPEFKLTLGGY